MNTLHNISSEINSTESVQAYLWLLSLVKNSSYSSYKLPVHYNELLGYHHEGGMHRWYKLAKENPKYLAPIIADWRKKGKPKHTLDILYCEESHPNLE